MDNIKVSINKDKDVKNTRPIEIKTQDIKARPKSDMGNYMGNSHNSAPPNLTHDIIDEPHMKPKLVPMDGIELLLNPRKTNGEASGTSVNEGETESSDYSGSDDVAQNLFNNEKVGNNETNELRSHPSLVESGSYASTGSASPSGEPSENQEEPKTYEEIQQEKQELLFKLDRLEKQGFKSARKYTMASNIEDIKYEHAKLKRVRDVDKSIKFQRKALLAIVSGIEFLNNKVDPIGAKLDGWSENMMENIGDYDEVFEELHDKYGENINIAPEIKLIMMVAGSAFTHHLSNSLFKSSVPGLNDILRQNPDIMRDISKAAANSMGGGSMMDMLGGGNGRNQSQNRPQQRPQPPKRPTNMRGPTGVDDILEELNTMKNNISADDMSDASESDEESVHTPQKPTRPALRKPGSIMTR